MAVSAEIIISSGEDAHTIELRTANPSPIPTQREFGILAWRRFLSVSLITPKAAANDFDPLVLLVPTNRVIGARKLGVAAVSSTEPWAYRDKRVSPETIAVVGLQYLQSVKIFHDCASESELVQLVSQVPPASDAYLSPGDASDFQGRVAIEYRSPNLVTVSVFSKYTELGLTLF